MKRSQFIRYSAATGAALLLKPLASLATNNTKIKLAVVGTGHRGSGFWAKDLLKNFGDYASFVALCDNNPGRMQFVKTKLGIDCPLFTDYDAMLKTAKPDCVIVTTTDSTHDVFIIKALEAGIDVITEKPMTTDEVKCKNILAAEKKSGKKVTVAFNYRHSVHSMQVKEILHSNRIGKISSVDFNWYLNVHHGADYFRRWHGLQAFSNSLFVHKSTHHFDLLNWWLNSEPVEVSAYGSLDHYGKNGEFRGTSCRTCAHKNNCKFYWDVTKDERLTGLYVNNEQHDGYLRDGCVFRKEIDIFDKMSAQILYANGVIANYSLTTYSPYEGWQIAFNGMNGRLETWEDIPYLQKLPEDQSKKHAIEMSQADDAVAGEVREIMVMDNFAKDYEIFTTPKIRGGHGGGDIRMQRRIFADKNDNPYNVMAGTRDGAMSILIGIAARKSIELKRPVKITELTDLVPMVNRF
jgi:predicted dehydrogenase